ncbi:hypothetical protein FOVSG1_009125 [Fusarium oxysporum f. sp. vasinfectum]
MYLHTISTVACYIQIRPHRLTPKSVKNRSPLLGCQEADSFLASNKSSSEAVFIDTFSAPPWRDKFLLHHSSGSICHQACLQSRIRRSSPNLRCFETSISDQLYTANKA